jgi:hypothetical protein
MRLLTPALLAIVFASLISTCPDPAAAAKAPEALQETAAVAPQETQSNPNSVITIPAGTRVELSLTSPVWSRTVKVGGAIHAVTNFPVAVHGQIAIPEGTYVQGQIDSFTKPGWLSPHAQFQIHFTKLIFANGYAVDLIAPQTIAPGDDQAATAYAKAGDVAVALATPYVQVSSSSDILLDNGTQIEMVLQLQVQLDAASVESAVQQTNPSLPAPVPSATMCRPTPWALGTPDTVISGTPGTPGTPDIVIPSGVPGVPDTVIPGTPATPGTPDTVIPGTPDTPGIACPAPPIVESDAKVQAYSGSFSLAGPAMVGGTQLQAGSYQAKWAGPAPSGEIEILQDGKRVATAHARILSLSAVVAATTPEIHANPDGTASLISLRFGGQALALYFDPGAGPAAQ